VSSALAPILINQTIEGKPARGFAAPSLFLHPQPGVDLSLHPAGVFGILRHSGASARHLFLVQKVYHRSASRGPQRTGRGSEASPKNPVANEGYVFFFNPAKTASAVIGMCRTRTPTAL
jgi:hypothetical protein